MTKAIKPSRRYNMRPAATWAAIRRRVEQGESARFLADWYGVGLRTIRRRAKDEGWRRRDLMNRPHADPPEGATDLKSAAEMAGGRAVREMMEGSPQMAQTFARLGESLVRLLMRLDERQSKSEPTGFEDTPGRRAALKGLREAYGFSAPPEG